MEGEIEGEMEGEKEGEMESEMEGKKEGEMEGNGENDANIKIDDDEQEEAHTENAIPEDVNLDPAIADSASLNPAIAHNSSLNPATADNAIAHNASLTPAIADNAIAHNASLTPAIADNAIAHNASLTPAIADNAIAHNASLTPAIADNAIAHNASLTPAIADNAIAHNASLSPAIADNAIAHNASLAPATADNTSLAPASADNTSLAPATEDNTSLAPAIADNASLVPAIADNVSWKPSLDLCVFQFYCYAKYKRSDTIQEMLCKPGISINATDCQGRSALMLANEAHDTCAQEILLANGALPPPTTPPISDLLKSEPSQDIRVRQVFETACLDYSDPEFLSVVLTEGAIGVNELNENGQSALMMAVEDGHPNVVFILIEHGADVSERVVRRALDSNRLDIMEVLLRASPKLCDALWLEVLRLPSCQMNRALVEAERGSLAGTRSRLAEPQLARAVRLGSMEAVLRLIEARVDVNTVDGNGGTAVHAAVKFSTVEMLNALIENGADVNSPDNAMNTPLDLALKSDGVLDKIVQELRLAGAAAGTVAGTVARDVAGTVAGGVDGAAVANAAGTVAGDVDGAIAVSNIQDKAMNTPLDIALDNDNIMDDLVQKLRLAVIILLFVILFLYGLL